MVGLIICLLLATILNACAPVEGQGVAVAAAPLSDTPRPTFVLAPADATATPTPFQPLAPTPLPGDVSLPGPTNTPLPSPTPVFTQAAPLAEQPALAQLPNQINILLLGADRRPWDQQFRTDTIMLVTLNPELGRVNITSFPRDLYIPIPGFGTGRINTAWTYGGYPLLKQTFEHNFGIKIDYFALVEFSSFKKVIDDLGGLTVNVGEMVSDYRSGYWVTIPAGVTVMDADTVLWYVRTRKTTNDIARNRRQQEVLQAIFEKLISMDALRRAPEFYEKYSGSLRTDLTLLDVLRWLPFAVKIAESRNIHQYYLTYQHVYDVITPEGAMVLAPQPDAMMQVIRKSQNLQ
jgi:LCP family protein required for cell wall assembly